MKARPSVRSFLGTAAVAAAFGLFTIGCGGGGGGGGGGADPAPAGTPPGALTLTAANVHCNGTMPGIQLLWTAADRADSYTLFRDGLARGGVLAAAVHDFDDVAGIAPGGVYTYFVRATNAFGTADSPLIRVELAAELCDAPRIPGAFALAQPVLRCEAGAPLVELAWTEAVGVMTYDVMRDDRALDGAMGLTEARFVDRDIVAGAEHRYVVRAQNMAGERLSNEVALVVPADLFCPPPAGAFEVTAAAHCVGELPAIRLAWTESAGAVGYEVRREDREGAIEVAVGVLELEDTDAVLAGASYVYHVRAIGGGGDFEAAPLMVDVPEDVCVVLPPPPPVEFKIVSLDASLTVDGLPSVVIVWSSPTALSFQVFRDDVAISGDLDAGATNYLDLADLVQGQTYTYTIRATAIDDSVSFTAAVAIQIPVAAPADPPAPEEPAAPQ